MAGRIDEAAAGAVERNDSPGVVAGVACGDTLHIAIAGVTRIGGSLMARDTLFRITSNTKPMTAAVVLSLVDDGVLRLDQSVETLLPELADRRVLRRPDGPLADTVAAERPITVRDLLTFTWGFGMQGAMFMSPEPWPILTATVERQLSTFGPPQPAGAPNPDTWMERLGELPLLAQPGERWLYSSGSQVLGVLISRALGISLDQAMRDRLFTRLGMLDTSFHTTDATRLATAYTNGPAGFEVTDGPDGQWSRPPAFPDGSGGLLSTVDDMVAFGRMLLTNDGTVLRESTVTAMTQNQLSAVQRGNVWPGFSFLDERGWGYGVSVLDDGSYGWDGGFGTTWRNVPSQDLTMVVLTQRAADHTGMPAVCNEIIDIARSG